VVRGPSSVAKLPSGGGPPGPYRELQAQVAGGVVGFDDRRPPNSCHEDSPAHLANQEALPSPIKRHQPRTPSTAELRDLPPASILHLVNITLELPEDIARQLSTEWHDLSRAALEGLALEAYRARKLTSDQMRRLLGFETRFELDGFLKQHGVWLNYSIDDLGRDRETHERLGL